MTLHLLIYNQNTHGSIAKEFNSIEDAKKEVEEEARLGHLGQFTIYLVSRKMSIGDLVKIPEKKNKWEIYNDLHPLHEYGKREEIKKVLQRLTETKHKSDFTMKEIRHREERSPTIFDAYEDLIEWIDGSTFSSIAKKRKLYPQTVHQRVKKISRTLRRIDRDLWCNEKQGES